MDPLKRKRSSPQPSRRSARLQALHSSESSGLLTAAKDRIAHYTDQQRPHEDKLKAALAAFLDWLPDGGRESVARDIVNATTDDQLHAVFYNLLTGLVMPMKVRSGRSSMGSSPHTHRFQLIEAVTATLNQPSEHQESFHDLCLKRDGHCCVVTGEMDTNTWIERGSPEGVDFGPVEVAHIIPLSYASWSRSTESPSQTASAWEVLWRCFPGVRQAGLKVETINSITNCLTMRSPVRSAFGKFAIAFKPTDTPNVYERVLFRRYPSAERRSLPASDRIEFNQAPGAEDLPLPCAAFLDCHYRLAEILNVSGMAETIDEHWRRWEDLKGSAGDMLHPDGGTDIGGYLKVALWERVAR
ncbi:hypothetical protein ASPZODRAFT_132593 [Penicilliopsis zonata CBS 506.65]|uniref:HNH nuclease domain-containing protein n=1 Tax=Penicilliopsis zonata CBS 506.65 TaxID=1073090 RepID=A0A1L9SH16_9EURO|nr:hypothetical protein ASPZODRAFT_132593 [Penicilliopsis zonata CBS 506.65]OJJ46525.1 hypothetical protein ASPZODRAFT_132593 [Penicilliopsis zonata CBS 506.65]